MATKSNTSIGCIGKCTSGLTLEELDQITDSVYQTLLHPKGKTVFRKYLEQARRKVDLACLDFYENCSEFFEKEEHYFKTARKPSIDFLKKDVSTAMAIAEDLDIQEIDLGIMERFYESINSESREAMLAILHDTKLRLMEHLINAHKGFRMYAMQPCPKTQ